MKILALDTSTEACSVALMIDDNLNYRYRLASQQHTQLILPMVDELLAEAQFSLTQLDCLSFCAGPGGFTGVRIAAGVVQGLAFGADLPVVPVSTLATMAQGTYREFSAKYILSAIDARMREVYWGVYQVNDQGLVEALQNDCVTSAEKAFIPETNHWFGVGTGWESYSTIFQKKLNNRLERFYSEFYPNAKDIITLAKPKFQQKQYVSADKALPVYLREKVTDL